MSTARGPLAAAGTGFSALRTVPATRSAALATGDLVVAT